MIRALLCSVGVTLAVCGGAVSVAHATDFNLPEFGEPADRSLPLFEERELGAEVFRQFKRYGLLSPDEELQSYIADLGALLVEANPAARGGHFRFFVVNDPSINAFAVPGGYIGIHTGLIRAATTEAELAGVMAHEIAHVTQRHIARRIDNTKGWDLASAALLLAAIAAGGADPALVQAALGLGMGISYQQQVNYTRAHELEADRLGIQMLSAAGYAPEGMAGFFKRIAAQSRLYGEGIPEILRTHPVSTTRLAEARSREQSLPDGAAERSLIFGLMQARAELAAFELSSEKLSRYPDTWEGDPLVGHYGRANALRAVGQHDAALAAARSAWDAVTLPEQKPTVLLELARSQFAAGQPEAATRALRKLHKDQPHNHAVTLTLAQWLLRAGDPEEVRQLLLESQAYTAEVPEVFRLLSQAAAQMDQPAEAQFQLANFQRARGDWAAAIRQLQNALAREEWDAYSKARLEGRLEILMANAPQSAREELRRPQRGPGSP